MFNTKEGRSGIDFKGQLIWTRKCRIWLHFLYGGIDLIGSLGANEPNTKNRDESGCFDDIILSMWDASCSHWWEDHGLGWRECTLTLIFYVSCQKLINLFLWYCRWYLSRMDCVQFTFGPLSDFVLTSPILLDMSVQLLLIYSPNSCRDCPKLPVWY